MSDLFTEEQKVKLWNYMSSTHSLHLLQSEVFDLWCVATETCRTELVRLERLVQFQMTGRVQDAEDRNKAISAKNSDLMRLQDAEDCAKAALAALAKLYKDSTANDFNEHWDSYKEAEKVLEQYH